MKRLRNSGRKNFIEFFLRIPELDRHCQSTVFPEDDLLRTTEGQADLYDQRYRIEVGYCI